MINADKLLIINELRLFIKEFPEYSIGEILYSIFKPNGSNVLKGKISDLLYVKDSKINDLIQNAKNNERIE